MSFDTKMSEVTSNTSTDNTREATHPKVGEAGSASIVKGSGKAKKCGVRWQHPEIPLTITEECLKTNQAFIVSNFSRSLGFLSIRNEMQCKRGKHLMIRFLKGCY